jgi:hypothetical protein
MVCRGPAGAARFWNKNFLDYHPAPDAVFALFWCPHSVHDVAGGRCDARQHGGKIRQVSDDCAYSHLLADIILNHVVRTRRA